VTTENQNLLWGVQEFHEHEPGYEKLLYAFSEQEIYPKDMEYGSYLVSQKGEGPFKSTIMGCRWIRLQDDKHQKDGSNGRVGGVVVSDDDDLVRYTMFGGHVKRHAGQEVKTIREFSTDEDRVKALREVFGLAILEGAEKFNVGRPSALSPASHKGLLN
jgi:hypothetical protein